MDEVSIQILAGKSITPSLLTSLPLRQFNLHLTGDIHAVSAANNLVGMDLGSRSGWLIADTHSTESQLLHSMLGCSTRPPSQTRPSGAG